MTREGTLKSGWCFGAPGARVPHRFCRAAVCACECHDNNDKSEDKR